MEPFLAGHRILSRRPQGTVFSLTEAQGGRLLELCSRGREALAWTRDELIAGLDVWIRSAHLDEMGKRESAPEARRASGALPRAEGSTDRRGSAALAGAATPRLARWLDRSPRAVALRLRQFAALGKGQSGEGRLRVGRECREVFEEFGQNRALLAAQARSIWMRVLGADAPLPELLDAGAAPDCPEPPQRVVTTVQRIIRDTRVSAALKQRYDWTCQICGLRLSFADGRGHAEAHHIRPLGAPHHGPDVEENLLVLCPNHHAQFDYGLIAIEPETLTICDAYGRRLAHRPLRLLPGHRPAEEYLRYHLEKIFGKA